WVSLLCLMAYTSNRSRRSTMRTEPGRLSNNTRQPQPLSSLQEEVLTWIRRKITNNTRKACVYRKRFVGFNFHSARSDSTGFARADLMVLKLIVKNAMNMVTTAAITNTHHCISIL